MRGSYLYSRSKKYLTSVMAMLSVLMFSFCLSRAAFATYSVSISTSSSITLDASPLGDGVDIHDESINVTTTCTEGYNLTLATTADSTLYLGGDSTSEGSTFSPVSSSYALSDLTNNANTWGYSLTGNTSTVGAFNPLSTTPTVIKSTSETATESESIDDTFSVYYGTAVNSSLTAGSYRMANNGGISYYLTLAETCADSTVVTFNQNLDGEGAEGTDASLTNFPTTNDNTIDTSNNTITLSNKRPTRTNYEFKEWNTEADGTGDYYYIDETIPMGADGLSGFVTLYAIWVEKCAAATVCYDGNHEDAGAMNTQSITAGTTANLIASNFSRDGYAFTGWNTMADGTGTQYGPNQNYSMPSTGGLNLYAQWLEPTGTLQTWADASNMNTGDVIALRDDRDDEVYMVTKLADGNVWITENLRLLPSTASITTHNTNNPTSSFVTAAPSSSSSSTGQCASDNTACVDQINYNAHNLDRTLTPAFDGATNDTYWYSYGVMYNWYTATAGNGTYTMTSGNAAGDLCPAGWHLPTGGSSGEWGVLANNMTGNNGIAKSATLRSYPNNFLYSGDYNPSKAIPDGVGKQGRIWSTTPVSNNTKNAYRMGYNSSEVTAATSNSWNKWDNFAIRCIYQGGNPHYTDVDVVFSGTGITSLTFTATGQDTQTATPQNNSLELVRGVTYTVTATTTTGYEVASWSTSSGATLGNTSTVNPAVNPNTYLINSDEATLTVTGQETPIYQVTTTIGEHVTRISFTNATYGTTTITPASQDCTDNNDGTYTCTVNLRRGIEYTLSSTFEEGHTITTWTTGSGGTLGDATSATTTYTITSATTLGITAEEADELNYTLTYSAGNGTDAPESETKTSYSPTESFTITNSTPIYYGYTFSGWTETENGSTVDYVSGDTITLTSASTTTTKTLYPVYQAVSACPASRICYYENGADVNGGGRGTMANQSATSSSTANLIPSNYSRAGYGFAGWTTSANATPYGPNAAINTPDLSSSGLALYAKWVKSEGNLQSWRGCNAMTTNQVIALTDTRDNNVYAVAKLADDNCWTIENLRLNPGTATITTSNTNNPTSGFITAAPESSSSDTLCSTDDDTTCINGIQYNTSSINRSLTPNKSTATSSWYSYGIYYNWYTATAGNGLYNTTANTNVTGDICPKNWHLPTSRSTGEWATLNNAVNGGVSNADAGLRAYPVNLIWSGDYSSGRTSGYSNGRYWSSTGYDANNAYRMGHQESGSKGATPSGNYKKWDGFAVRCIRDEITAE